MVTGAYGFLGKYVIKELVSSGYRVRAFGRKKEELEPLVAENVEVFQGDFCQKKDCQEAMTDIDYVIHCGALSTVWGRREDFINTNVVGTVNLMKIAAVHQVKRFIYVSSPSIYAGKAHRLNIKENEVDTANRLNYYIESKILAEAKIREFKDLEWVIIRPRGLIGVGDTSIMPRLIYANEKVGLPLFNDGQNLVDMTCVENVALALRLALKAENAAYGTFNITNGEPMAFKEVLSQTFESLGIEPHFKKRNLNFIYGLSCVMEAVYKFFRIKKEPIITRYSVCTLGYSQTLDISAAREKLGYEPKVSLAEGIENYAKSYHKS